MDCNTNYASCSFPVKYSSYRLGEKCGEKGSIHLSPTRHPKLTLVCPRFYKISEGRGRSSVQILNQGSVNTANNHQDVLVSLKKRNASHTVSRVQRLTPWLRVSMVLLAFGVGQFMYACQDLQHFCSLSPQTHTLNVSHWVKQKCLQTFPNSLLGWEVLPHFQQKGFPAASGHSEISLSL